MCIWTEKMRGSQKAFPELTEDMRGRHYPLKLHHPALNDN
jgi:hypothetical protein